MTPEDCGFESDIDYNNSDAANCDKFYGLKLTELFSEQRVWGDI